MPKIFCPVDGSELKEVGDEGIVGYDGNWEAQASKFRCADGKHIIFVVDADAVEDPYEPAFDAAYQAVDDALKKAVWLSHSVKLKSDLLKDKEAFQEPIVSLEDLRNELAHRAVFAFKDVVEEELDNGYGLDKVEYEYIQAMEDVDELLDCSEHRPKLEALGWVKGK